MPQGSTSDTSRTGRQIDDFSCGSPPLGKGQFYNSGNVEGNHEMNRAKPPLKSRLRRRIDLAKKSSESKPSKKIFSTRVETWRYYSKSVLCPACNEEAVPIIFTKQQKFTTFRLGAICLLGCWPICFLPFMMSGNKRIRLMCPVCGHQFKLPKPASIVKESSEISSADQKFTNAGCPYHRTECRLETHPEYQGRQVTAEHRYRTRAGESQADYAYESEFDSQYYGREEQNTCCRGDCNSYVISENCEATRIAGRPCARKETAGCALRCRWKNDLHDENYCTF